MNAELISIGDEITCGKILDTNSQWLAIQLGRIGIKTCFMNVVGDELPAMVDVIKRAAERADVIIITGGLGPTADDLTRQAIADVHGLPLVLHDELLEYIRNMFAQRGREMPPSNEVQALLPQGAVAINNPHGTAPGIDLTVARRSGKTYRIIALPGVPAEMKEMYYGTVEGGLLRLVEKITGKKRVLKDLSLHCFGAGESKIESMLPDVISRDKTPRVGITASRGIITLRIQAESDSDAGCQSQIEPMAKLIREKLGTLVFGENDEKLQDILCKRLREQGKTLAVCEVATRGRLSETIASSRYNDVFGGGAVLNGKPSREDLSFAATTVFPNIDYVMIIGAYNDEDEVTIALMSPKQSSILTEYQTKPAVHPEIRDDMLIWNAINMVRQIV
ncbi:MAG: CinA family nicotinamide mononucleotide deamidase-related protein [Planctomycetaceae bacterium]|jgi:nicotinamide-nucleotide amidase|nr:CinA family nicotinamide mononucleotide deamidase-related protein [Planctomycetaceae bacterium]